MVHWVVVVVFVGCPVHRIWRQCSNRINIATLNSLLILFLPHSDSISHFSSINFSTIFYGISNFNGFCNQILDQITFLYRRFFVSFSNKKNTHQNTREYLMRVQWLIHKNGKPNGNAYNYTRTHTLITHLSHMFDCTMYGILFSMTYSCMCVWFCRLINALLQTFTVLLWCFVIMPRVSNVSNQKEQNERKRTHQIRRGVKRITSINLFLK